LTNGFQNASRDRGPRRNSTPRNDAPRASPPPARLTPARAVVLQRLTRDVESFPDLDITPLETDSLSPRDAAFAHQVHDLVIRHWAALRHVLAGRLTPPTGRDSTTDSAAAMRGAWSRLEPPVAAALLAGYAQIVYMDRVPTHAAINESVEFAKVASGRGAGGLVNAVLRKAAGLIADEGKPAHTAHNDTQIISQSASHIGTDANTPPTSTQHWHYNRTTLPRGDGHLIRFRQQVLPEDPLIALAIVSGIPSGMLSRWRAQLPDDDTLRLAALHALGSPPVIINAAHAREPLPREVNIQSELLTLTPHASAANSLIAEGTHAALRALLASRADLWVQDVSSAAAVSSLAPLIDQRFTPRVILDLCAGQGTKTRQLAATFPHAKLLATDVDPTRLATLRGVFAGRERPNDAGGSVRVMEYDQLLASHPKADLILLDVPCSNTGVFARRVQAKHRCNAAQIARLNDVQRSLIERAVGMLADAPDATILYATCSLEREENEDMTTWACTRFGLSSSQERRAWPTGLTTTTWQDGAYSVTLRRTTTTRDTR
jgi:16S rRNA (cytosine967-C5)-methyltransferase